METTLENPGIVEQLSHRFPDISLTVQTTVDGIPTLWIPRSALTAILTYLKNESAQPFDMLFDLCGVDERTRVHREGLPPSDFTVVYHLMSFQPLRELRLKVALTEDDCSLPSVHRIWPSADWYEREAWDMFGIEFSGHPHLRRILLPPTWEGHPLRKDHPARATEMGPLQWSEERQDREQEALKFRPEEWGMERQHDSTRFLFLNMGPNHPSVHGIFRIVLQLDGEIVVDAVPDIGYHHRGAEKMAERQTWHSFIPYTDRIDYLAGVMNNLPYVMTVEQMAGIKVPPRAQVIRIMLAEMFRLASHLVFYGTYAQDIGQLSPVFYMFSDRERIFDIVQCITGGRMHPSWFRIGGVAQDLPEGWETKVRELVAWMPGRLNEYEKAVMKNGILKGRMQGIGVYSTREAYDWAVTGPGLRATGVDFDLRRDRPYGGYDQFEFEVPVSHNGDAWDRGYLRLQEMRQSVRIIEQCLNNMPSGPYKSEHPSTTPPPKERTMHDIETLIHHFLSVSWGPVVPAGECSVTIEATKGNNMYYLTSDGAAMSYRTRIRTPSFPHLQQIPLMARGVPIADLVAILGSIDFVMADVDR